MAPGNPNLFHHNQKALENSPTTFPDFLVFHVPAGYGIQHYVHTVNVTENQALISITKL